MTRIKSFKSFNSSSLTVARTEPQDHTLSRRTRSSVSRRFCRPTPLKAAAAGCSQRVLSGPTSSSSPQHSGTYTPPGSPAGLWTPLKLWYTFWFGFGFITGSCKIIHLKVQAQAHRCHNKRKCIKFIMHEIDLFVLYKSVCIVCLMSSTTRRAFRVCSTVPFSDILSVSQQVS